ncbi:MAG: hypothetical protein Q9O62_13430 [Ardenticatenia bacterium]|nr:hypothetical protein [Ardenticatenia bacterium]
MNTIVLVACVSKKLPHKAKARELYISPLFRMNLKYAQRFSPQKVFILPAKYELVQLDEEIEPYDVTLNKMSDRERRNWAAKVVSQLQEHSDLGNDHFVILAGQKYRQYLLPHLRSYEVPLAGLPIGKQLQFLKEKTAHE